MTNVSKSSHFTLSKVCSAFAVGSIVIQTVLTVIVDSGWFGQVDEVGVGLWMGSGGGQVLAIALFGSLTCRSWPRAVVLGVVLSAGIFLATSFAFIFIMADYSAEDLYSYPVQWLTLGPFLLFCLLTPPLLARLLLERRIVDRQSASLPRQPIGVQDLLLLTVAWMAAIVSLQWHFTATETVMWLPFLIGGAILFASGCISLVGVYCFLSARLRPALFCVTTGLVTLAAMAAIMVLAGGSQDTWLFLIALAVAWLTYAITLILLRMADFRFVGAAGSYGLLETPPQDDETARAAIVGRTRIGDRWIGVGFALLGVLAGTTAHRTRETRRAKDETIAELSAFAESKGGRVDAYQRQVQAVTLPNATPADVQVFAAFQGHSLSLPGLQNADEAADVIVGFRHLDSLELDNSDLTSDGLRKLSRLPALQHLSLKGANFRVGEQTVWPPALHSLFLDDTPITDDDLAYLPELNALSLVGTRVSDAGLERLRKNRLGMLDLRGTDVAWKRWDGPGQYLDMGMQDLDSLRLDGSKIVDANCGHIPGTVTRLTLSRTSLTDKGVKMIRKCKELVSLDLSSTAITDESLKALSRCPTIRRLSLRETNVTGSGFADWRSAPDSIDLTNSRLDDAGCQNLGFVQTLSLRGADVTDSGLAALVSVQHLDIRDTAVSWQGVLKLKRLSVLVCDPEQVRGRTAALLRAFPDLRIAHSRNFPVAFSKHDGDGDGQY